MAASQPGGVSLAQTPINAASLLHMMMPKVREGDDYHTHFIKPWPKFLALLSNRAVKACTSNMDCPFDN